MPRISKVRIVNFNYNDGKRLIADELFNFESSERADALNVLINLANGGGKSVLVQLMMQPILPKAKVANRRIESFFSSVQDHYFVVLEWLKDGSNEKLLTGISMGARQLSSGGDDDERGMGARYYTFYAEYVRDDVPYSIVNLPLSHREKGRFLAAAFNEVRERYHNRGLYCYSSDDQQKWRKKLEEYGLAQDEWRMIEKLNSEEGGLGKFFGDFKSSDALIEKLLIPQIESKLDSGMSCGDSSLSTMLLSYVNQYARNQDRLKEKQVHEEFARHLQNMKPQVAALWSAKDHMDTRIRELFGLSDAFAKELSVLNTAREKAGKDAEDVENQIHHIRWEDASDRYYAEKEKYEQIARKFAEAEEVKNKKTEAYNRTEHALKVQECAGYFETQQQLESTLQSIKKEIAIRESGGDSAEELAKLKYSAYCAAQGELSALDWKRTAFVKNHEEVKEQLDGQRSAWSTAQNERKEARTACVQAETRLNTEKDETDRIVEKIKAGLQRRLDGFYPGEEAAELVEKNRAEDKHKKASLDRNRKQQDDIRALQEKLPGQMAVIQIQLHVKEQEARNINKELDEYREKEEKLYDAFQEYSLDFSQRFGDVLRQFLRTAQTQNRAEQNAARRKIDVLKEEIEAVERGSVHVPDAVIQYLNAVGISYTTCEKYLQDLMADGKLAKTRCLEILQHYPAVAYGILMDERSNAVLMQQEREQWLPAMVPIFSYAQMDKILKVETQFSGAIAFYSQEYFSNRENYQAHLEQQQSEQKEYLRLFEKRENRYEKQIHMAEEFTYSAEWKQQQLQSLEQCKTECREQQTALSALQRQQKTLAIQLKGLTEAEKRLECAQKQVERQGEWLNDLRERMVQEEGLDRELCEKQAGLREAESECELAEKEYRRLEEREEQLNQQVRELNEQLDALEQALRELEHCTPAEKLEGTWRNLLDQYRELQKAADRELESLKQRMQEKNQDWQKNQNELDKRELPRQEYCEIRYSKETESSLRQQKKQLLVETKEAEQRLHRVEGEKIRAQADLENSKKALEPFGEALEKSQVGTDFAGRIQTLQKEKQQLEQKDRRYAETIEQIEHVKNKLDVRLDDYERPENPNPVVLQPDYRMQFKNLFEALKDTKQEQERALAIVADSVHAMEQRFSAETNGIEKAVRSMKELLESKQSGDRYYTLHELVENYLLNTERAIHKITTDLAEFEHQRGDLVQQCTIQGERIYKGLQQMEKSSRVVVHRGKPSQKMIRFDMPAEVDLTVAAASIANEIELGVEALLQNRKDGKTEIELQKQAERIIGSKTLLHKYIGKDSIQVEAYKIDQNPQNSKYRTWEKTQVNNSGAEKFVVYFAVILSLIHYTRTDLNMIQDKELHSTLILDNPFGATSSEHILIPMFEIARHFRVQMICLSDINKADVINCFDIVIRAIVKKRPLSSGETLTHEENEQIEHGFYRSEQISMLD